MHRERQQLDRTLANGYHRPADPNPATSVSVGPGRADDRVLHLAVGESVILLVLPHRLY